MQNKKFIVIICSLMALCAISYWSLQPSPSERPKAASAKLSQQQVKSVSKERRTTSLERRPRETARTVGRPGPVMSEETASQEPDQIEQEPKTQDLKTPSKVPEVQAQDSKTPSKVPEAQAQEFEKRVQDFKGKYKWDDPATTNLGEYLIGTIPEQLRDSGLTAMIKNLDEAQQQEGATAVDERMLLQSIEKLIPENIRPSFRKNVEKYKAEHQ
jgi:hypothetical protein